MEERAECMLVLIGATPEGRKELVGFQVGVRESAQSWRALLVDVKQRGLSIAPEIAVGDGALGFWKALDEVWASTRHQRCWVVGTVFARSGEPAGSCTARCATSAAQSDRAPVWSSQELAARGDPLRPLGMQLPRRRRAHFLCHRMDLNESST